MCLELEVLYLSDNIINVSVDERFVFVVRIFEMFGVDVYIVITLVGYMMPAFPGLMDE